jgi:NAD(P)-dependent dehydrogenase (short-subunit alcohol dehydrogenase family)
VSEAARAALAGCRALVTGASRGIGAAIARRLAAEGAEVVLVARGEGELAKVADGIRTSGGAARVLALDVTDRATSARAVEGLLAEAGPVDVLVNNAGGNVRKRAEQFTLEEWDRLLALALTAPFQWSRLVFEGMRARRFGRIVNVASVAGMVALPTGAPYAAAKAGLIQLTKNLAREWGPHGITVNAVAPWYVPTPLTEGVLADAAFRASVLAATPAGRLGTPEEVAAAVAFLAGPEAGWITGTCLPLDGGFTAASFHPAGMPPAK